MTYRKKLIEVSLPLEAINVASAREKSIRHGHPSTLHLWWARRPLAACRAVLFSSLVDDPSEYMPDEESARIERERLFGIIEDLVLWENINNEEVLDKARMEIARSVARNLNVDVPVGKEAVREFLATKAPPILDPFAGGGSIPLEAQRLGLRAYASDLNPVAVLINKAMIEIPPKFANMPPVHPADSPSPALGEELGMRAGRKKKAAPQDELWQREWKGAQGLAEDVRYYGKWMRDEAFKRIGHLYPPVTITKEILDERSDLKERGHKVGDQLTVIAWLWARTVKCPNPACGAQMPLTTSFAISTKKGNEAWVEPVIKDKTIRFVVKTGKGTIPTSPKIGRGAQFRCVVCQQIAPDESIRNEFKSKHNNAVMTAIVVEGFKGRVYLSPIDDHIRVSNSATPLWKPSEEMNQGTPNLVSGRGYGFTHWSELFTSRQLAALTTFSDLVIHMRDLILNHSKEKGISSPESYADAVSTYLAFAVDKLSDKSSTFAWWMAVAEKMAPSYSRQALAMVWDYAEMNPFCNVTSNFAAQIEWGSKVLDFLPPESAKTLVRQWDAASGFSELNPIVVSTDPPYYDNISYADLSDYFYIWLRYSLSKIYPDIFATMMVPKEPELVATPFRFDGDKRKAEQFFESGLHKVFRNIYNVTPLQYPVTIFYAFKQSETKEFGNEEEQMFSSENRASTGWETMLSGLIESGFEITGTWPMRTERSGGLRNLNQNALASSIVLVCRPRLENTTSCSRREFLAALKKEVAPALRELQQGSIAPVDLAQASIGPGMAVFSRYSTVLEADGKPMSVRTALGLINQALDEFLAEQEGEYDGDTRWALTWFEQYGHNEAAYGMAETLSRAKNTSVDGLSEAGIVEARGGKVRLYKRDELDTDWDPTQDKRLTAWESAAHLIYALENGGEESAAELLAKLGPIAEVARDLAYRLYTVCERKGWSQDALGYNMLVVAWPRLKELAAKQKSIQENLL